MKEPGGICYYVKQLKYGILINNKLIVLVSTSYTIIVLKEFCYLPEISLYPWMMGYITLRQ